MSQQSDDFQTRSKKFLQKLMNLQYEYNVTLIPRDGSFVTLDLAPDDVLEYRSEIGKVPVAGTSA